MSEKLAGWGEGLKGLVVKWGKRQAGYMQMSHDSPDQLGAIKFRARAEAIKDCMAEIAALEAAAPAGTAPQHKLAAWDDTACKECGLGIGYWPSQPECAAALATPSPQAPHNELSLVRLVLSAHQTAYAKFHNGEGRGVIEADQMAIGYASVELAKALRSSSVPVGEQKQEEGV